MFSNQGLIFKEREFTLSLSSIFKGVLQTAKNIWHLHPGTDHLVWTWIKHGRGQKICPLRAGMRQEV